MSATEPLLSVRDLSVAFGSRRGETRPVRGISFDVRPGQRLGLVGESGSGKSLTALAIMRLIKAPGRIAGGRVLLEGRDLLELGEREMAAVRGGQVAMIYQNPLSALNPVQTIGHQLVEAIRQHRGLDARAAQARAIELLGEVHVPDPQRRIDSYPHQFSGGMLQRVVIAMALSCDPKLVIADEATTALDVTTQARIVELLLTLVEQRGAAVIFITHDLGVAAALCEDVQVMYAGRIVERASAPRFYERPVHPYSEALPGPVYLHCHHGKHRGPAAAAVALLCLDGECRVEDAVQWMRQAGTDARYTGLYAAPHQLRRPTQLELDQVPAAFPETAEVTAFAQVMVVIDEHWEHLKQVRAAGWKAPPNHPDVDPPHEALQLREHYREMARLPQTTAKPEEFRRHLTEAETDAAELEAVLRRGKQAGAVEVAAAEKVFRRTEAACARCHARYRDVPQSP